MINPLLDYKFLYDLDRHRNRITYVRITSLTLDELPIEQIEGVATGGSITIDGSSNVRRICSLTMSTKNLNINNVYWGITTKIKLELGLDNNLVGYSYYDNIIWFPMGTYVLNDFKTSAQVNNYTISLSGKDKMCLLNGDISGEFNAETDLGTEDVWDDELQAFQRVKRPIDYIIREMVHHYAQENYANIIIKDIKNSLEMLSNRTKHNIFIIRSTRNGQIKEVLTDLNIDTGYYHLDNTSVDFTTLADNEDFHFQIFVDEDDISLIRTGYEATRIMKDGEYYAVDLIAYGDDVGYAVMPTEFPEDLIAAAGDTVTSILDKIIKYFTNYEYFYNSAGQFVFQEKQTYVNTAWNGIIRQDKENFVDPSSVRDKVQYSFEGNALVSANQNNPNIGKIKNDYTVWGKKKTASGSEYPIHMRYAIDLKPKAYRSYAGIIYITEDYRSWFTGQENVIVVDWREIIYQMALDYYAHNHDDDYHIQLRLNNILSVQKAEGQEPEIISLYPTGRTGYEQYYHDIQGFWRMLYIPDEEREAYFSSYRIMSGTSQQIVSGFSWEPSDGKPYTYDFETAKIEDNYSYAETKEFYIADDGEGTLKAVDNDKPLEVNGITYTLKLLVERDNIIQNIEDNELLTVGEKIADLTEQKANYNLRIKQNTARINEIESIEVPSQELIEEKETLEEENSNLQTQIDAIQGSQENPGEDTIYTNSLKQRELQKLIAVASAALAPYNFTYFCEKNEEDFYKDVLYTLHGFPQYIIDDDYISDFQGYNKNIILDPQSLIFWFDFFDAESLGLGQFSVPAIGDRPKTTNNDGIRALIYPDAPDIIFINEEKIDKIEDENDILNGYTVLAMPEPEYTLLEYRQKLLEEAETEEEKQAIQQRIDKDEIETEEEGIGRCGFWRWAIESGEIWRSTRSTTAQEEIDNLLYDTAYCNENVSITSIPIYYLIPNTIISADDEQRNIGGYYILDKMTIPLNYNGTMQSTAIKVPERIY